MSQKLVKLFWETYRKTRVKGERIAFLRDFKVALDENTEEIRAVCGYLTELKSFWTSSAELYDELAEVRALNSELEEHIRVYGHTMTPELHGRLMRTWATLNDYFKTLNTVRALIEENQDIITVLDLISQRRKNKEA